MDTKQKNLKFFLSVGIILFFSISSAFASVKITSPSDGATIGGIVPVTVEYSGTLDYPVIYLSGGLLGRRDFNPPELSGSYTDYWDTSFTPNGTQRFIYVYAWMAGSPNGTSDIISVTVNNPYPEVNIASPTGGAYISPETTNLSVTLEYHNVLPNYHGIRYISFVTSKDDVRRLNLPDNPTSGSYTWNLDIRNYPLGKHWILAYCEDTSGKYARTLVNFIKGNPPAPKADPTKQPLQKDITTVAEPINVANGNMFTSITDISIPGVLPLELSRTYNSQDDFFGSFGYGWRSNFDITLTEQPDSSVIEVDQDGVYTIYAKQPDGSYTASAGKYSTLVKNSDSTFILTRKSGNKLFFNSLGLLTKIEDRNGNTLNILRDASGILQEVSDSSGRKLQFIADSQGKIIEVKDQASRSFKYEYDSNGNLIKTIDPLNNQAQYSYDTSHNLTQTTDANNHSLFFEYDSSDRCFHSWQDNQINEVTLSFDSSLKTTITTDSLGNTTKYEYNTYGLVFKITDAQANIQSFVWDDALNKTSSTDKNGNTTSFSYDLKGNLLSLKDPLNNLTAFTYTPDFSQLASTTDSLGDATEYAYDSRGNLTQTKDALNNITTYTYNLIGQLLQTKDAKNNITTFDYDTIGNLSKATGALNNVTTFTYDALGNLLQTTDALGNSTQFSYDLLNRLAKITYADTSKTTYNYDSVGNLISFIDPNNNTTTYSYDAANRLIQTTDAQGNSTRYSYDTEGNRLSITDANSNQTKYIYDSLNRLIKTQDPLNHQTLLSYDANGNLIAKTDAKGTTVYYFYDALNRLTEKGLSPQGTVPESTVSFTYDTKGNLLSAANQNISYSYTYNPLNRLVKALDSHNRAISYSYDALGNKLQMTSPEDKTTTYSYDALNRLTAILDIYGKTTSYTYDALGRRTAVTLPNDTKAGYSYDILNNLLTLANKTNTDEIISSYSYEYDKTGNRLSIKGLSPSANEGTVPKSTLTYTYDTLYRLTQVLSTKPKKDKLSESYTYDSLGNRFTSLKDTYTYNSLNQLLTSEKYSYDYDANGNLIQKTEIDEEDGQAKTTTYVYDFENRLTQVLIKKEDKIKSITFKYDPFGRRIEKKTEEQEESGIESKTTNYIYDNEDIILEYCIKTEDNETKEETTRYAHGPGIDEPISIEQGLSPKGTVPDLNLYYYHYDGLGSITGLTDEKAKTIETYEYDSFGNLKRHGNKTKNAFIYTGREYDKETGLYYYRNRYYDPKIGRFITADPLGMVDGPNLYTFVNNNPLNWVDPWGLYKQTKDLSWWQWYLYESVMPGPYGQPISEWGSQGPASWGDPMKYTEEAGGGRMWSERSAVYGGIVFAVSTLAVGTAEYIGLIDTVAQGNNIIKILSKPGKWGFRIDKAHHGKPWGHPEFWKW